MPTVPAYAYTGQERWNCDVGTDENPIPAWNARGVPNQNRYGRYSQVLRPSGGGDGIFAPGSRTPPSSEYQGYRGNWGGYYAGRSWWNEGGMILGQYYDPPPAEFEGSGHYLVSLWFRNLNIARGQRINSAYLKIYYRWGYKSDKDYRFKIWGIAEDNVQYPRFHSVNIRTTYNNMWSPYQLGNAMRFAENSWEDDREHTRAYATWSFRDPSLGGALPGQVSASAEWTTSDISPVLQEIVDRPGWEPTNRLCLMISSSGSWGLTTGTNTLGYVDQIGFASVLGYPLAQHPKLVWT